MCPITITSMPTQPPASFPTSSPNSLDRSLPSPSAAPRRAVASAYSHLVILRPAATLERVSLGRLGRKAMCQRLCAALVLFACGLLPRSLGGAEKPTIHVKETDDYVQIDTDALQARIRKKGYVSGTEAGSFLDKKTGARDVGFGLHIMDFLMAPGWRDDGYARDRKIHGNLPKHYIEGPQICTQARELKPEIIRGDGFVAVKLRYRFKEAAKGLKAGSLWEQ